MSRFLSRRRALQEAAIGFGAMAANSMLQQERLFGADTKERIYDLTPKAPHFPAKAKHVITVAKLNYSEILPGIKTSMPGVNIINTSHIKDGTLNVNETVRVAETKLEEILAQ